MSQKSKASPRIIHALFGLLYGKQLSNIDDIRSLASRKHKNLLKLCVAVNQVLSFGKLEATKRLCALSVQIGTEI